MTESDDVPDYTIILVQPPKFFKQRASLSVKRDDAFLFVFVEQYELTGDRVP